MLPQPAFTYCQYASLNPAGVVTSPSFHLAPARSPVMLSGESTSVASFPASSRIASTTSSVTSSQPASVFTWSSPTTCFSTNRMSLMGATYSAICALPLTADRLPPTAYRSYFLRELRNDLEQVAHEPVVGDLEDRRLRVLVDGDDHLAVLHAGQVLDRAGDAHRDVELGRDDLARLSHLVVVRAVPRIHGGARSTDGRTQLVGERLDDLEVLPGGEAAPARDDAPRAAQLGTRRLRELLRQHFRLLLVGTGRERFDGRGSTGLRRFESGRAHRDHLDGIGRLHRGERIARVDRAHECVGRLHAGDLGDLRHVEERRDARHDALAERGGTPHEVRVTLRDGHDKCGEVLGTAAVVVRGIHMQDLLHAGERRGFVGRRLRAASGDEHVHVPAHLRGRRDRVVRAAAKVAPVVFRDDKRGHMTLASFLSLSTSSPTSFTMTPALRMPGSATLSVFTRGATSTPSASAFSTSSGFFFAFMMLGSVAYRGLL